MRLLNLSTGRIRTQLIDGEEVRTAYVKTPVAEPWVLTPTGPEGDEVAVHSDHLYVFDHASYDYWAAELGVPRESWGDGHFAENLTLDVLDQTRLHVGDRFRLGTAVIVVTGPRVPCWKLTWRLGQPKTFMRRFRLSGHSGAYFGVVEPGVIRPGDELALVQAAEGAPTVAELSRLCDSGTRVAPADRAVIDRALALPELSDTVRATLELKIANLDDDTSPGSWRGWRRFEIDREVAETPDARSFSLRPLDGGILPGFHAGQHVVVRMREGDAAPVVRTWSLSEYAAAPERYRITVRIRPDGLGSPLLARAARGGVTVELRQPSGRFRLNRGSFRPVMLIAAGIGITPLMAMVRAHLERSGTVPPLWLLYGSPAPEHTAFRAQLDALAAAHADVHVHYFFSRPTDREATTGEATAHRGRLTTARALEVLRGNYLPTADGPAAIPWFESDIYLCGPEGFAETMRDELVAAGANPDLVFVEDILAATSETVAVSRHTDAVVRYGSRAAWAVWPAAEEPTLLELGERSGLRLPFDCRAGTCRTCESRLLCGEVDGAVSTASDGSRRVLLCVSYPASDLVEVEPPAE
jgi:ferredoxin-NADP reductase/MOSC domain-containing protein YiiM/ferredoxin